MHPYATNANERHVIPLYIAGLAFLLAWGVRSVLSAYDISLPFWIEVPSVAGLYGIGHGLFKHKLWRVKALSRVGWVQTPTIEGEWIGRVRTSFDDHTAEHEVRVSIKQNWTELAVHLKSQHSRSHSVIGAITVDPSQELLSYEYVNEPLPDAVDTMHTHRGTARLRISPDRNRLEGEYYSGRDRKNQGLLILERS